MAGPADPADRRRTPAGPHPAPHRHRRLVHAGPRRGTGLALRGGTRRRRGPGRRTARPAHAVRRLLGVAARPPVGPGVRRPARLLEAPPRRPHPAAAARRPQPRRRPRDGRRGTPLRAACPAGRGPAGAGQGAGRHAVHDTGRGRAAAAVPLQRRAGRGGRYGVVGALPPRTGAADRLLREHPRAALPGGPRPGLRGLPRRGAHDGAGGVRRRGRAVRPGGRGGRPRA